MSEAVMRRWIACLSVFIACFHLAQTTDFSGVTRRREVPLVSRCRNPNGRLGTCMSIYECETLRSVLHQRQERDYGFVQASRCAGDSRIYGSEHGLTGKPPYVCCNSDTHFNAPLQERYDGNIIFPDDERLQRTPTISTTTATTTTTTPITTTTTASPVDVVVALPEPPQCGAVTISNKIYGGVETDLNEFSWMANLEYRRPNGALTSVCAGSLINERYVLTAAHCVRGEIEQKIGQLVSLRLGDHNTANKVDCDAEGCNEPSQRIGLESITVHEDYNPGRYSNVHQQHDIALLRLEREVQFTKAIQPVCLPNVGAGNLPALSDEQKLTVAGWGHNGTAKQADVKQKVRIPYVDQARCRSIYAGKMHIADEQLCAGGVYQKDSCTGDSGGPLMRVDSTAWILEGVVSFGRSCGLEDQPGIYTRVRSYMHWIEQHVKP